jgi:transcriptional regulator with XRE-family HTH domain
LRASVGEGPGINRKDFGALIASLRDELGWTQDELAQATGLDESAISVIERGARRHFEPDLLYGLANALQLTTLERREFLLAASGAEEGAPQAGGGDEESRQNAEHTVRNLTSLLGRLHFPCYLVDVYGEIIAANGAAAALYKVPLERLAELAGVPGGLTLVHLLYDASLGLRSAMGESWELLAVAVICDFRAATLRYRTQPYFKMLLKRFRNPRLYPAFDRLWRRSATMDEDRFSTLTFLSYYDDTYGGLEYCVSTLDIVTPYGELFLNQCIPMDEATSDAFRDIVGRVGAQVYRFAPWPEKQALPGEPT